MQVKKIFQTGPASASGTSSTARTPTSTGSGGTTSSPPTPYKVRIEQIYDGARDQQHLDSPQLNKREVGMHARLRISSVRRSVTAPSPGIFEGGFPSANGILPSQRLPDNSCRTSDSILSQLNKIERIKLFWGNYRCRARPRHRQANHLDLPAANVILYGGNGS